MQAFYAVTKGRKLYQINILFCNNENEPGHWLVNAAKNRPILVENNSDLPRTIRG